MYGHAPWAGRTAGGAKADWKVGIQTWTFHNLTLMETLDKTQQLGMGYAEAFFSKNWALRSQKRRI